MTFFEQLVLPYMMLVPHRSFRCFAAMAEIFFQFCIVGTGNYAWINYVGILPCLALLDDDFINLIERNIFAKIHTLGGLCQISQSGEQKVQVSGPLFLEK